MEALSKMWTLLGGALTFDEHAFAAAVTVPGIALVTVLLSGLAEAAGQSVVLFINRVKPRRFIVSLVVNALLFTFTFLFWALSIYLLARFAFGVTTPYTAVARIVGLGYAPRLFGLLAFLPVVGVPIATGLILWSLLATLFGVSAVLGLTGWQSLACVALGAVLLLVAQRTVGSPLMALARRVRRGAAGVDLVTSPEDIRALAEAPPQWLSQPEEGA